MINIVYVIFFYLLIAEVVLFLLLTLKTPDSFKSKIVKKLHGSDFKSSLIWMHLALSIFAALFFLDLSHTQASFKAELGRLKELGNGQIGTEVRMGFYSYRIQEVERNKYITGMVIYASLALNFYIRMMYLIYKRRGDYQESSSLNPKQQVTSQAKQSQKQPSKIEEKDGNKVIKQMK